MTIGLERLRRVLNRQIVRPRGPVLHRPPILGVTRVRDRVPRAQEGFPELTHPRCDVGRRDVWQGDGCCRVHESVGVEGEPPGPRRRDKHRVLCAVAHPELLDGGERRVAGEDGRGRGGEGQYKDAAKKGPVHGVTFGRPAVRSYREIN